MGYIGTVGDEGVYREGYMGTERGLWGLKGVCRGVGGYIGT